MVNVSSTYLQTEGLTFGVHQPLFFTKITQRWGISEFWWVGFVFIFILVSAFSFESILLDEYKTWTRLHGPPNGPGPCNTRAKRLRMRKVSIFKLAVANANFTTRMPVFELKSNFISIQNFKAGNVKPPGMHWSKDF